MELWDSHFSLTKEDGKGWLVSRSELKFPSQVSRWGWGLSWMEQLLHSWAQREPQEPMLSLLEEKTDQDEGGTGLRALKGRVWGPLPHHEHPVAFVSNTLSIMFLPGRVSFTLVIFLKCQGRQNRWRKKNTHGNTVFYLSESLKSN